MFLPPHLRFYNPFIARPSKFTDKEQTFMKLNYSASDPYDLRVALRK